MAKDDQKDTQTGSYKYWLTLEQWRKDPEFQKLAEQEFLSSPLRESAAAEGGWARREFLKLMGASMALTSFGCVRRPAQKIVPYNKRPADVIEGIENHYASSFHDGSEGFGTVINTREGRPFRVEGNELHPMNQGGMSARATASVLGLYDPNRLSGPVRNLQNEKRNNFDSVKTTYEKADKAIAEELKKGRWALLTSSIVSPSQQRILEEFAATHGLRHVVWDALNPEHLRAAQETCYGRAVVPRFRPDRAKYILSVDSDFLGTYVSPTECQRLFMKGRRLTGEMNKLVAVESTLTFTGTNADERYRIRASHAADFLSAILNILIVKKRQSNFAGNSLAILPLQEYSSVPEEIGISAKDLEKITDALWANRGKSLVIAGEDYRAQVAANILNSILGNDGSTVDHQRHHTGYQGSTADLNALIAGLNDGSIERVLIHGCNPVYAAPGDLDFVGALKKAKFVVHTGTHMDETARFADFVLPDHHQLEAWGDLEAQKGVISVQQPTIRPLGDTRALGDTLIQISKAAGSSKFENVEDWYAYLRNQWKNRLSGNFEQAWVKLLQDGVWNPTSDDDLGSARSLSSGAFSVLKRKKTPRSDVEVVLYPSVGLRDGSMANIPWLQEFPDPVSKICWDNTLNVSPKFAEERGLKEGQIAELQVGNRKVTAPVHVQPGLHDAVVAIAVGYGRTAAGEVADGVGVNVYPMAAVVNDRAVYKGLPAMVKPTASSVRLACVAGHNTMEGRQIVVEATLEDYKKDPGANIHRHKIFSAWSGFKYEGTKWGMAVDLNSCTGCGACVIACQSENNVPTVGKRYVVDGREMHWMRIDRYYVGDPSNPDTVHQPVMCQHCDNAPCETVCPVAATVHGEEGTNDMIYNRCVGTRYCANNCPYKVRRFNWFNYSKIQSPRNMALNPEVTVRSRGVMEKCTFCIHKIKAANRVAKLEDRRVRDGEVVTACQSACPTDAIIFGNVLDAESKVSLALKDGRTYSLLEELNTEPAVKYQSKIRNTEVLEGRGHGSHGNDGHHEEEHAEEGGHA